MDSKALFNCACALSIIEAFSIRGETDENDKSRSCTYDRKKLMTTLPPNIFFKRIYLLAIWL